MFSILKSKKGFTEIAQLQTLVTSLVVIGIVLGVGFMVLEKFYVKSTPASSAAYGINETIYAVREVPGWLPIVIIVAIASVILALVFRALPGAGAGGAPGY